jgi:hypothetical protein
MDHSSDTATFFGVATWTGYREKFDEVKAINMHLKSIGDTLLAFSWLGTKSWSSATHATGTWANLVSSVSARTYSGSSLSPAYVETGHFQHQSTGTDYLLVLNRRSAPGDSLYLSMMINKPAFPNAIRVTDIETGHMWNLANDTALTDLFHPSECNIYRVDRGLGVTISGPQTRQRFENGTYTATPGGGTPPYQYNWWYNDDCDSIGPESPLLPPCDQWVDTQIKTASYVHSHQYDFQVRCTVTDATGFAVTSGGYYVRVSSGLAKKSGRDLAESALPERFGVREAYPNPFNPSTTLEVALPVAANVRMEIFDIAGREVGRLANGAFEAGYHNFT